MTSPQQRRDPHPMGRGGELALVVLAAAALVLALAALAGLGVASALVGGGWVWPSGSDQTGQVLIGLVTGHPGAGLPPALEARVPGQVAVYSSVTVTEIGAVTAAALLGVLWRYARPGIAGRGMATRAEAAHVLGRSRLRSAHAIIRPDLAAHRRRGQR